MTKRCFKYDTLEGALAIHERLGIAQGFAAGSEPIDHDSNEEHGEWRDVYDRCNEHQNRREKQALVSYR